MVSNSTDIHSTPEEIKPKDHMISSQAGEAGFFSIFRGSCPLIIILYPQKVIGCWNGIVYVLLPNDEIMYTILLHVWTKTMLFS